MLALSRKPKSLHDLKKRGQRIIYKSVDGTKKILNANESEVADTTLNLQGKHIESIAQRYNTLLMACMTPF